MNNNDFDDIDEGRIITGKKVEFKKLAYTGHIVVFDESSTVDDALRYIKYLGTNFNSTDCIPFALSLLENNELVFLADDNGEFGCSDMLKELLTQQINVNATYKNIMICVTRYIQGFFVVDMFQEVKLRLIKEAAKAVIEDLKAKVISVSNKGNASSPRVNSTSFPISNDNSIKYISARRK